jgi:ribosome-associated translation inhibitor RaiA
MAENIENLMLEHLKRFQGTLDRIEPDMRELKTRQSETHSAVISLRRDQVQDAEVSANIYVHFDALKDRLDRIERRLELTN